ncbi:LAFE_0G05556g1_1 [Lachancea fermentati]|uniref:LAFE_0G05556g1_1 n=1 Tax=Lachancea fermentati TaxID=4955 RepID=A0A1G4MHD7_LACFM|nr:LAFE_0G05556g1_1 [Lachancea fermentati]
MPDIVFDIVGTCISYENCIDAIKKVLGERFAKSNIDPKLFFFFWLAGCERDFSYLSQSGTYKTFQDVFKYTFYRSLYFAGVEKPREYASDEDLEEIYKGWWSLEGRPELKEMFQKLRDYGFTIWCLTDASKERVAGYFKNSGVEMPSENLISCDSIGAGKPEGVVYKYIADKIPGKGKDAFFAAAHMWDSAAARQGGFVTAWSNVHELEPCCEIFGSADVMATGLVDLADKVIAKHKELTAGEAN